jgi:hypothetical protein
LLQGLAPWRLTRWSGATPARRAVAKIRETLFRAFVYNVVGIPLAALGWLSPVVAGELKRMRQTLEGLIERCHGDHHPDCPILDEFAEEKY